MRSTLQRALLALLHLLAPFKTHILFVLGIVSRVLALVFSVVGKFLRVMSVVREKIVGERQGVKELKTALQAAATYHEWEEIALQIDILEGKQVWKDDCDDDELYDAPLIQRRLAAMKKRLQLADRREIAFSLRADLLRNLGNLGNAALFGRCRVGTKVLIEEYLQEVDRQLRMLCNDKQSPFASPSQQFEFFWATRQSFGRSALLLSGGASFGVYHVGVIKALFDEGLLPRIISGSSVGAVVACLVGVRTRDETPLLFEDAMNFSGFQNRGPGIRRKLDRLFDKGYLMDVDVLGTVFKDYIGDYTFLEAFNRTRNITNVLVGSSKQSQFPRLLNYLTAPDVVMWSAALASCAVPGIYAPVSLLRKMPDGTIVQAETSTGSAAGLWGEVSDLPMNDLKHMFNVNHFIVSQVNPHVIPFIDTNLPDGSTSIWSFLKKIVKQECIHLSRQAIRLGVLPGFLRSLQPLIDQKYTGDITITPNVSISNYYKAIANPSADFLRDGILEGARATWPKMSIIRNHCMIEQTLEACVLKLRQEIFGGSTMSRSRSFNLGPVEAINHDMAGAESGDEQQRDRTLERNLEVAIQAATAPGSLPAPLSIGRLGL